MSLFQCDSDSVLSHKFTIGLPPQYFLSDGADSRPTNLENIYGAVAPLLSIRKLSAKI